ncbi:MAG: DUF779 domain-containing protein [Candidatus Acididesulfobacter guangdongensis]|uniref:DUF779 domain-containing protein n=1 Tax=Acididesulfobacter guangdongensis TaxID=2597225 RepID=A0A519BEJ2_ACIG2|nr:MAG: DUF779 domain-containing protein [Candidatus Acididesulfobacter guangdongensis]
MHIERISITEEAKAIVDKLREKHGELMFHQSGGCCDGSAPMCFSVDDFIVGSRDLMLGEVYGCKFYMAADQFEYYKNLHLTIDVVKGRGSSFSLEIPLGIRFIIRSRLFTDEEFENIMVPEILD